MTKIQMILVTGFVILGVLIALVYVFKALNSPSGERYLRQRSNGSFVPRDGD